MSLPSAVTLLDLGFGKIVFPELERSSLSALLVGGLDAAQLDAANLARNRFRQFGKFEPAYPFEGRERGATMPEDGQCSRPIRGMPWRERKKCLRHGKPYRIGRRHHCGLGHGRMLDQDAF